MKVLMKQIAAGPEFVLLREHVYNLPRARAEEFIRTGAAVPYSGTVEPTPIPNQPDPEDNKAQAGWSDEE
jgi:hypothetical protein